MSTYGESRDKTRGGGDLPLPSGEQRRAIMTGTEYSDILTASGYSSSQSRQPDKI